MKSSTKITKVIGTQAYINKDTKEVENFEVIQMEDRDFNFEKIWLAHILEAIDSIGNKKLRVVRYLLENRSKNNNIILGTIRSIAKDCGVGTQCVQTTIAALIESNFMTRIQQGAYQINPAIIFKGRSKSRMNILYQYRSNRSNKNTAKDKTDKPETII